MKDLSILIPTLPARINEYSNLIKKLSRQILINNFVDKIQIVSICDTKDMSIGKKRNLLLSASSAKYICFIDDDDTVSDLYIQSIMFGIHTNADVITFCGNYYCDNNFYKPFILSKNYHTNYEDETAFYRLPNHICPVKKEIAMNCLFSDTSFGEDTEYGYKISSLIQTEYHINEILYYYHYNSNLSFSKPENNLNPYNLI